MTEKSIKKIETYIGDAYRYKLEVTLSIDWVELFLRINPNLNKDDIWSIIQPFRDDKDSLISINSITWLSEKDSIFWYNALQKTYRYSDFTEKTIDNITQSFGSKGELFGYFYKNKHLEWNIRSIFTDPDIHLEGTASSWFGKFLITPEKIWFPIDEDWSSEEIGEVFSNIPFQGLVDTCIQDRKLWFYWPSIIESIREKFPDNNYTISVSDRPSSFDIKSGPVSLSVTIDIYNAKTPFELDE